MPRSDQMKHAIVSFGLTGLFLIPTAWFGNFVFVAPVIALGFGVYKEIDDRGTTGFDWTDILADVVGIALAMILFFISIFFRSML